MSIFIIELYQEQLQTNCKDNEDIMCVCVCVYKYIIFIYSLSHVFVCLILHPWQQKLVLPAMSSHIASLITYHLAVPAIGSQSHHLKTLTPAPYCPHLRASEMSVLARQLCLQ